VSGGVRSERRDITQWRRTADTETLKLLSASIVARRLALISEGLTLKRIARLVGVGQHAMRRYERGELMRPGHFAVYTKIVERYERAGLND